MEFYDFTESFLVMLGKVYNTGNRVIVRGMETVELQNATISISNPLRRVLFVNHRNDNIFAKVAETLWMLAGRDDIEWLSYYLPRAKDFSDNGKTWRGAYGPRLRNWNGHTYKADQLKNVANKLNLDPSTRQAVISIWDPSEDFTDTKDVPCNNWVHFYIRNSKLNMNVVQRSSDVLWGYSGIDFFSWSTLMQMMAHWSGVDVGTYTHFMSSLHLYDRHYAAADKILEDNAITIRKQENYAYMRLLPAIDFSTDFEDLDEKLQYIFNLESTARKDGVDETLFDWADNTLSDPLLATFAKMLLIYIYYTEGGGVVHGPTRASMISKLPESDLRAAVIEYYTRKNSEVFRYYDATPAEIAIFEKVYQRI